MKPANLEQDLRSLLCGSRAIAWYRQREQEITEARTALCSRPELGPTMQDGGEPVAHPTDALSSEQYYQILESLSRIEEL
ncbi:MAG: hypothetical protein GY868_14915 [Deltaproteobacteria bacterium]|nr:hypothetical protein [Deltaproteobacteria bacterium]